MSVESATDLAGFFDTDYHAVAAVDKSGGVGGGSTVNGIFDNEFVGVLDGGDVTVESATPIFTCQASDIATPAHGDTVTISAAIYTVRGVQPDGTGVLVLILEAP